MKLAVCPFDFTKVAGELMGNYMDKSFWWRVFISRESESHSLDDFHGTEDLN